ncbi:MAG TPA: hypothetical protein VKA48_03105 [Gammaproteobacteria bacterium]|nr:hypothetical protein [Gammaproteobacteria bacterium]
MTKDGPESQGSSRLQLWLLLLVFASPIIAATLFYANSDRWLEQTGTGHHGQLLNPARPLKSLPVQDGEGNRLGVDYLQGKWTLVYIGRSDCQGPCERDLYGMRQAHMAQGKNTDRIQRLYIAQDGMPRGKTKDFLAGRHPYLTVAHPVSGQDLSSFRVPDGKGGTRLGGVYLVDPHANLVLSYGTEPNPKGILEDLETLLKHSSIG